MRRVTIAIILGLLVSLVGFQFANHETEAANAELHVDLWNQATAYRLEHATTVIQLPPCTEVIGGELNLTAYNADSLYARAIRFYLGGDGGHIGTYYIGPGQVGGSGIIGPGQTKSWVYDLSQTMVADGSAPSGYRYVDFIGIINDLLQSSTPIEVQAWVTTYTSTAWISASVDLEVVQYICDSDGDGILDDVDACPYENASGLDANLDGCIDTLRGLEQTISGLPVEALTDGIRNSLLAKTEVAISLVDNDKDVPAINVLKAITNQVEAQKGKKIEASAADMLIGYANNVITQLISFAD